MSTDFFSWIGDSISSASDWLFSDVTGKDVVNAAGKAVGAFSSSSQSKSSNVTNALMTPPKAQASGTRAGPGINTTQVASKRPAPIHTTDQAIFTGKDSDPWMYTFRSIINKGPGLGQMP